MLWQVNTTDERSRNLILIGFMGTGKTTIGRNVAKSLRFRFVDTDQLIRKKAEKSIPDIFAEDGEAAFRQLETEVMTECAEDSNQVISTGGGIVTEEINHPILKRAGYVVWLKASAETIYDRVKRNQHRPLLQVDDPMKTIEEMLAQRESLYSAVEDLSINTDKLTLEETAFGIVESTRLALQLA
ncbi:MAG: shikimate kinase [Verrucomicrobiota bacterium]